MLSVRADLYSEAKACEQRSTSAWAPIRDVRVEVMSSLRAETAVLVGARLFEKALGLVALMIFARMFELAELALIPFVFLAASAALVVFGAGILPTVGLEVPKLLQAERLQAESLIGKAVLIGVGTAVLSATGVVFLWWIGLKWLPMSGGGVRLIGWLAAAISLQCLATVLGQLLVVMSRFRVLAYLNIMMSICRLVTIPLLYVEYRSEGILAGLVIVGAMGSVVPLGVIMQTCRKMFSTAYGWNRLFRLSWPYYSEGYVMLLRGQGDQLVVTAFLGAEPLALYYVARRPYEMLRVIADSIDSAVIPTFSRLSLEERDVFLLRWRDICRPLTTLTLPLPFLAAACVPLYLTIVGEEKFDAALLPATLLCFAFIADIGKVLVGRAMFVLSHPVRRLQISVLEAAAMLIGLLASIPWLGVIGVAGTYVAVSAFGVFLAWRVLRSKILFSPDVSRWGRSVTPPTMACLVMVGVIGLARALLGDNLAITVVATAVGVLCFGIVHIAVMQRKLLEDALKMVGVSPSSLPWRVIQFIRS